MSAGFIIFLVGLGLFFAFVAAIVAGTIWCAWNDTVGRRHWSKRARSLAGRIGH